METVLMPYSGTLHLAYAVRLLLHFGQLHEEAEVFDEGFDGVEHAEYEKSAAQENEYIDTDLPRSGQTRVEPDERDGQGWENAGHHDDDA